MNSLVLIVLCSFGLGAALMPGVRALALRCGLVDAPDGRRKMQRQAIPLAGGIAVFFATTAALTFTLLSQGRVPEALWDMGSGLLGLLLAALVICGVGLADDFHSLRGRHKLFGQLVAIGIVMSTGVVVRTVRVFGIDLELGPLAFPFTALWLLAAINALNLLDGMDGLLGCVGVIITLALAALAVLTGQWAAAAVACALAGALLAFLCFNLPPASVFLGDCGSMLVGLVVGVLAIQSSLKGPATVALAAPLALLTIPFFDTLAAIVRRKLTGRSIYSTDRGHIHHVLQRRGLSSGRVLVLVSALCGLTVAGMLASVAFNNELMALIAALVVVNVLVVGRLFGHAEFQLIKERLVGLVVWQLQGRGGGRTHQLAVRLQGSSNWTDLWGFLTAQARDLGLRTVCLDVNAPALHEGYHARWDRFEAASEILAEWRIELPLLLNGQVVGRLEFTGDRGAGQVSDIMWTIIGLSEDVERALAVVIDSAAVAAPDPAVGTARQDVPAENLLAGPAGH
jgi:UDP-GlcNAc:undecaprenyl-phosphate/decaprenyl-phosphate GlcNAc-1-phosphate transferase